MCFKAPIQIIARNWFGVKRAYAANEISHIWDNKCNAIYELRFLQFIEFNGSMCSDVTRAHTRAQKLCGSIEQDLSLASTCSMPMNLH